MGDNLSSIFAGVAQSVVQLIRNQQVACSSHVTSSNNKGQSKDWPLLLETYGDLIGFLRSESAKTARATADCGSFRNFPHNFHKCEKTGEESE